MSAKRTGWIGLGWGECVDQDQGDLGLGSGRAGDGEQQARSLVDDVRKVDLHVDGSEILGTHLYQGLGLL